MNPKKKTKTFFKDFSCDDKSPRCGKIRLIKLSNAPDEYIEVCHLPEKRPIKDIKCIVLRGKDLERFKKF